MRFAGSARLRLPFRKMRSGCGRGCVLPTASASGLRRWERAGDAFRRCMVRRRGRHCCIVCGRSNSPIVCCSAGRARQATAHDAEWHALATLSQRWTPPVFPLKAADFMKRGVVQGPSIGVAIAAAEQAWIAAGFPSDRAPSTAIAERDARAPAKPRDYHGILCRLSRHLILAIDTCGGGRAIRVNRRWRVGLWDWRADAVGVGAA